MAAVIMVVIRAINAFHDHRRRRIDDRLMDDDTWLLHDDWILYAARTGKVGRQWGLLDSRDDIVADTLLMEGDDLTDFQSTLHPFTLQLTDNQGFAQATAAHVDHVRNADTGLRHSLLLRIVLLLLLIVRLLLQIALPLQFVVMRLADHATRQGSNGASDENALRHFVVLVTHNATDNRPGQSACRRSVLSMRLCIQRVRRRHPSCGHYHGQEDTTARAELCG